MVRLISQEEGIWFVWLHVFHGSKKRNLGGPPRQEPGASASPSTLVLVVPSMVSTAHTPLWSLLLASEGTVASPSQWFLPATLTLCFSMVMK